jgi:hypothetical protein
VATGRAALLNYHDVVLGSATITGVLAQAGHGGSLLRRLNGAAWVPEDLVGGRNGATEPREGRRAFARSVACSALAFRIRLLPRDRMANSKAATLTAGVVKTMAAVKMP